MSGLKPGPISEARAMAGLIEVEREIAMKLRNGLMAAAMVAVSCGMQAQTAVKRIYGPPAQKFANAIWAGDTLYVAGQMASPATPADKATGAAAVYGDTKTQTLSALKAIETILKKEGL